MHPIPADHPLRRLFAGWTEHAFHVELGVADPTLIDYITGMLSRFVVADGAAADAARLPALLALAASLPEGGRTQREAYRQAGDAALFWAGLFPEAVRRAAQSWCKDGVLSYCEQGRRSYRKASDYADDDCAGEAPVLRRLSDEFELCAYGLGQVRREWEQLSADGSARGKLLGL